MIVEKGVGNNSCSNVTVEICSGGAFFLKLNLEDGCDETAEECSRGQSEAEEGDHQRGRRHAELGLANLGRRRHADVGYVTVGEREE